MAGWEERKRKQDDAACLKSPILTPSVQSPGEATEWAGLFAGRLSASLPRAEVWQLYPTPHLSLPLKLTWTIVSLSVQYCCGYNLDLNQEQSVLLLSKSSVRRLSVCRWLPRFPLLGGTDIHIHRHLQTHTHMHTQRDMKTYTHTNLETFLCRTGHRNIYDTRAHCRGLTVTGQLKNNNSFSLLPSFLLVFLFSCFFLSTMIISSFSSCFFSSKDGLGFISSQVWLDSPDSVWSAGITGVLVTTGPVYEALGVEARASWVLHKHATSGAASS